MLITKNMWIMENYLYNPILHSSHLILIITIIYRYNIMHYKNKILKIKIIAWNINVTEYGTF